MAKVKQEVIWQPQPGPQTRLVTCPVFEVFFDLFMYSPLSTNHPFPLCKERNPDSFILTFVIGEL